MFSKTFSFSKKNGSFNVARLFSYFSYPAHLHGSIAYFIQYKVDGPDKLKIIGYQTCDVPLDTGPRPTLEPTQPRARSFSYRCYTSIHIKDLAVKGL